MAGAYPPKGSQGEKVLKALASGRKLDVASAYHHFNVSAIGARVSELRRLGWPVRSLDLPHPNREECHDQRVKVYVLDEHFRNWFISESERLGSPDLVDPVTYGGEDGRGKFATWSKDDYERARNA